MRHDEADTTFISLVFNSIVHSNGHNSRCMYILESVLLCARLLEDNISTKRQSPSMNTYAEDNKFSAN